MQHHWHNMRVTKYRPCLLSHDMQVCHVLLSGVRCPVMFIVWTLMHTWRVSAGQRATDTWTGVMHLLFVRLIIQRYTQCKNSCLSFCRVGSVFITFHCNLSAYSVQYQQNYIAYPKRSITIKNTHATLFWKSTLLYLTRALFFNIWLIQKWHFIVNICIPFSY